MKTLERLSIAGLMAGVCLALEAAAVTGTADRCPHWISVMPLAVDDAAAIAEDAVCQGNESIVDGVAWICSVHPKGDPVSDAASRYAEDYRRVEPLVRARSHVRQGILLQSTMGHGGFPGQVTPWQLAVKADGARVYRMCPLDGRFLDYVAKACRTFSALNPDFFMVDDDTRLTWDGVPGCFCPLHLAAFAKLTGRAWTRESLAAAVKANDPAVRPAWEALMHETMTRFFRTVRENFAREIPGMLCTVSAPCHFRHAREYAEILAAPGQTPVVRGNGANYGGNDLFHVIDMRAKVAQCLNEIGPGVVYLQEADTCPQTVWSCSAKREYENMLMETLEGLKGAKIWITRTRMTKERRSQAAYRRILSENRGIMEWAANADFRQQGVVQPLCGKRVAGFAERYLAIMGIPYRYGMAGKGDVWALCADNLKTMPREEISEALAGRVLLDGSAAIWLSENGFSGEIGVRARGWTRKTVQSHRDERDVELGTSRTDALFADLTARVAATKELSRFYNVPYKGADPVYVAPGSLEFRNARGGHIIVFAMPLRDSIPRYYDAAMFSESYKEWIVRLFKRLGGCLPGGVCFAGAGVVMCEAGTVGSERVFVLDPVDVDDIVSPEMAFDAVPSSIERLGGDGLWRKVPFDVAPSGLVTIRTVVQSKMPAVFRFSDSICRK